MKKRRPHDTSVQKATGDNENVELWMQFNVMPWTYRDERSWLLGVCWIRIHHAVHHRAWPWCCLPEPRADHETARHQSSSIVLLPSPSIRWRNPYKLCSITHAVLSWWKMSSLHEEVRSYRSRAHTLFRAAFMNNTWFQFTKETKNVFNLTNEIVTHFRNIVESIRLIIFICYCTCLCYCSVYRGLACSERQ